MRIKKVINNNIIVVDKNDQEIILMGRGLGFKKHTGDAVIPDRVEKEYYPKSQQSIDQLSSLLTNIELEDIRSASKIIMYARNKLSSELNETEIISLSDHIHNSIERSKQNISLKNNLLWDIKRFYPKEFEIGMKGLEIIQEQTNIALNEDEAGFIALHIVDAEMESGDNNANEITKFIQEVTQILKYACHQEIDERTMYYYRFVTHLKYLAQRILSQSEIDTSDDKTMLNLVSKQYPNAFSFAVKIADFINSKYQCSLSNDELMYLTLHIEKMIQLKAKQ